MTSLFKNESSDPKRNAQRNLMGRTHYVDDDTLRWHKSRIISARHTDGGLLFAIVTSDALVMDGSKRGFRFVIFDLFGTVIARTDLEGAWRTSAQAKKVMWQYVNAIDAKYVTTQAIERQRYWQNRELDELAQTVSRLETSKAEA